VYITSVSNGFSLAATASTNQRTLKVFVGEFAAQAKFEAVLSDGSAAPYAVTNFNSPNPLGGISNGVYTLTYAADGPDELILIEFTMTHIYRFDANVGLLAAALTTDNNPPFVSITSPTNSSFFVRPTNITITTSASDSDGSVRSVEFFADAISLGQITNAPFTFVWSNAPLGVYALTAVATDDKNANLRFARGERRRGSDRWSSQCECRGHATGLE